MESMDRFTFENLMPETPVAQLDLGPDTGDSTKTVLTIQPRAGIWEFSIKDDNLVIKTSGNLERDGLLKLAEFLVKALK